MKTILAAPDLLKIEKILRIDLTPLHPSLPAVSGVSIEVFR
jgi:hypothetical protein